MTANQECVFCKIVEGIISSEKVYEDENFFVFLDIKPINPGHLLIVPKQHVDDVFDLPDMLYTKLFVLAKTLAPKLRDAVESTRVGVAVEGFGVAHAHVHLVPLNGPHELNPERAKETSLEKLRENAERIRIKFS
ncbi:HIT family protein [Candidatus Wolfebacteria bacterium]|nr:HIT family protein [Candidatus Wolfebacteria bacterium]